MFDKLKQALRRTPPAAPPAAAPPAAAGDTAFERGRAALERGEFERAAAELARAVADDASTSEPFRHLCFALFQLGRTGEAMRTTDAGIAAHPDAADLHFFRGNLCLHLQRLDDAAACYRRAAALEPALAGAHLNLAAIHLAQDQPAAAEASLLEALSLDDSLADAHRQLARLLQRQGRAQEASDRFERAMSLTPDAAEANRFGAAFLEHGQLDHALRWFERAVSIAPGLASAHCNCGVVQMNRGRNDAAADCFRAVLAIDPDHAPALNYLGTLLVMQGDSAAGERHYRRALAADPSRAGAHCDLGTLLDRRGDADGALQAFQQALALDPQFFQAHNNIANILQRQNRYEEALAARRTAAQLAPRNHSAHVHLLHLLQILAEWDDLERVARVVRETLWDARSGVGDQNVPFAFLSMPHTTPAEQKRYAVEHARSHCGGLAARRDELARARDHRTSRKLRIGYVSADFREHAVALLIAEVLELHDRSRFHVTGYALSPDDGSSMRRRLVAAFDDFVELDALDDVDAARRIGADQIDVLVDLMGYTQNNRCRMLALRPAPVQATFLGYPGTMGADFIDYLIADRFIVPPALAPNYAEEVLHLPFSYLPRDRGNPRPPAPSRAQCGLPAQALVLCCFNQTTKITPEVFSVWCRLLLALPGSVFWMPMGEPRAEANLRREAAKRGVDPARFIRAPRMPAYADHLARLQCADLFLDTVPYNAHTTCSDALWMGLPVVTCAGTTFASRVAGSLLTAIGSPELVADSLEAYYALAFDLAADRGKLAAARAKLIANRDRSGLFDSDAFVRGLEQLYESMWSRRAAGR